MLQKLKYGHSDHDGLYRYIDMLLFIYVQNQTIDITEQRPTLF